MVPDDMLEEPHKISGIWIDMKMICTQSKASFLPKKWKLKSSDRTSGITRTTAKISQECAPLSEECIRPRMRTKMVVKARCEG